jgi:hypothetical protein
MNFAMAFAAAMSFGASVQAAQIVLDARTALATPPGGSTCTAPCYEVRAYLALDADELTVPIESIQFEVAQGTGADIADMPTPPATNVDAINPNAFSLKNFQNGPWGLSATVGASPDTTGVRQVLFVLAASAPFTFNQFAANYPDGSAANCAGPTCAAIGAGVAGIPVGGQTLKAVYLGSFNSTITGTSFDVSDFQGTQAILEEVRNFHSGSGRTLNCTDGICAATAPEPAGLVMLGLALAGVALAQRRS